MLGDNVKKYRKENGLTQQELAKQAGVSLATVKTCETNKSTPKYSTLKKIASVLNVSVNKLNDRKKISQEWEKYDRLLGEERLGRLRKDVDIASGLEHLLKGMGYTMTEDIDRIISSYTEDHFDENGVFLGKSEIIEDAEYLHIITKENMSVTFTDKQFEDFENKIKEYIIGLLWVKYHENDKPLQNKKSE